MIDKVKEKIEKFGPGHPSSTLFTHFDKNIYIPNEDVWFTSYLLNYNKQTNNPSILTALLVKNNDKSIVTEHHFAMSGGLSFGHLIIPSNIAPGEYSFLIYTNIMIKGMRPVDYFIQPIAIMSATRQSFFFTVERTLNKSEKGYSIIVTKKDGKPVPHALVTMTIDTIHFQGETDRYGKYSTPVLTKSDSEVSVYTEVSFGNETSTKRTRFHNSKKLFKVNFYPEGGDLVYATPGTIGWEVKGLDGKPAKVKALLMSDNVPIDTIETDNYGVGQFRLLPACGSIYKVRLLGVQPDSVYRLPKILSSGSVISMNQSVCSDSLWLRISSPQPTNSFVFIHDYAHTYFAFPVKTGRTGKAILVRLQTVPKGLCAVTVVDSVGRPLSERLFFAHFDKKAPSLIQTDFSTYRCRQKVNMKLRFSPDDSEDTAGVVSIACVESNRLDSTKTKDIATYTYLTHVISAMPFRKDYLSQSDDSKAFLENMLLIKGWRRFTWQDIINENGTSFKPDSIAAFQGCVTHSGHMLNKPVNLLLTTDSLTRVIKTEKNGQFTLNKPYLSTEEDRKIQLRVRSGSEDIIKVDNPFADADHYLINYLDLESYSPNEGEDTSDREFALDGFNHVIALKEVIINGKSLTNSKGAINGMGANACGDYVCSENVLNCTIHASEQEKMPAKKGGIYGIMTSHRGDDVFQSVINGSYMKIGSFRNYDNDTYDVVEYLGCKLPEKNTDTVNFEGVLYAKEFYPMDYSNFDKLIIDNRSTIFWDKLCLVSTKRDTDLSFYTSDITGKFKIVIQGLLGGKRIFSEKEIFVSP